MIQAEQHIVDMQGLSEVLNCSVHTLYKNWKQFPHVFIGTGRNASSARFIINDVLSFLTNRDYTKEQNNAISRQKKRVLGGGSQKNSSRRRLHTIAGPATLEVAWQERNDIQIPEGKNRFQTQKRCDNLGERTLGKNFCNPSQPGDPFNLLKHIRPISQTS
ncbi:MAG: hypothetical protein H8D87_20350 [Deltaproteobacteria bacterium]|uniref:hypothetical protein n=1 Tax=Desulfobacula sp. TaxID=2593537 RepID=UPI0019C28B76|nr:hypothetical protein [Candidatus Desulfobacula maris]MBL6992308.1 hypothetical protein [Desulfobacula sp.]